jgi:hypothetical protein
MTDGDEGGAASMDEAKAFIGGVPFLDLSATVPTCLRAAMSLDAGSLASAVGSERAQGCCWNKLTQLGI